LKRGRGSAEVLQGFGCRLVLGEEASLAIVDTSLAWVFPGALENGQLAVRKGGIACETCEALGNAVEHVEATENTTRRMTRTFNFDRLHKTPAPIC